MTANSYLQNRVMAAIASAGLAKVVVGLVPETHAGRLDYFPTVLAAWKRDGKPAPTSPLESLAELVWRLAEAQHPNLDRPVLAHANNGLTQRCNYVVCEACEGSLEDSYGLECPTCRGLGMTARVLVAS